MIDPMQVHTRLCRLACVEDGTDTLLPLCSAALGRVMSRLLDGVDEDAPLIADTAAALAFYDYSLRKSAERQGMRCFKAGDITVNTNADDEMTAALRIKTQALADAASILRDTGFEFRRI